MQTWFLGSGFRGRALALVIGLGLALLCPDTLQAQVSLVSVSPARNATGVATTTTVVFTFSGAIVDTSTAGAVFQTGTGVVATDEAWSAGNTVLTVTPTEGWPASTVISWTFFAFIPPLSVISESGQFTTVGGQVDTTPPTLSSSSPANAATAIPINSPIRFTFSETMQGAESIAWSANLTPAKFAYSWSSDGKTLTCQYSENLPSNASITWKLNPSGFAALFKDASGNPLATDVAGGFSTSDVVDPCLGEEDGPEGGFNLSRQVSYTQTGTAAPVEETPASSIFGAFLTSPTNNPVTAVQLTPPTGPALALSNFFGSTFMFSEEYATQAELDAARPPGGSYTLRVTRTTGGPASVALTPSGNWPPTPQILNLPALQAADATSDIVVQWNGFPGAGTHDGISISIGPNFYAPDLCSTPARPLASTATQITVPAGTLETNQVYEAILTFTHVGLLNTNAIADIPVFLAFSKEVSFQINTGSSTPGATPQITNAELLPSGHLQLHLTGTPGKSYTIESSPSVSNGSWSPVHTAVLPVSGDLTYDAGTATTGTQFFRAKAD